ncbi:unnamed protein product [Trichobilharzia szidati]|nr:unnamed protein product [Trichobilharzia szidati]CAH8875761.1 unnamed protein product [Trichobilharzia szidati]
MIDLSGYVCLVTGATRGIGKGVAVALGKCGATVYITGRTLKTPNDGVGGSLQETTDDINKYGGKAIPVVVDHSNETQVTDLFNRISREQNGRLDILVNNVYSAVSFISQNIKKPFYDIRNVSPGEAWDIVNNTGLKNHYICCVLATRMMIEHQTKSDTNSSRPGLIVNITSVGAKTYLFNVAYGTGKAALDRMTKDMAKELKRANVNISIVGVAPGLVRTEHMLNFADKGSLQLDLNNSESPELTGRVISQLASEPSKRLLSRSGQVMNVCDLAEEFGIKEDDGRAITNLRSIKFLLSHSGFSIAKFIPSFIKVPEWLFDIILKYK